MEVSSVSRQTLRRLPQYLNYLKTLLREGGPATISATAVAEALSLNDVQVRKDLASVCSGGRPKVGYITADLAAAIEEFLGYNNADGAVLVGAGNLGLSLMGYEGFERCGLDIIAAFDTEESVIGEEIHGKPILPADKMQDLCRRMKVRLGIISVPASAAQGVCDLLVESGCMAIWNFAPVHLIVPRNVLVQNENLALSLSLLSKHLRETLDPREDD